MGTSLGYHLWRARCWETQNFLLKIMSGATPGEGLDLLDEIDDGDEGLLGTQILGALVTKKPKGVVRVVGHRPPATDFVGADPYGYSLAIIFRGS